MSQVWHFVASRRTPRRTLFGLHPITCCALGSVSFMPSTFVKTTLGPMLWERGDGGLQGRRPLRSRNGRFFYGPISRLLGRGLTRRPMAGGLEIAWGDWGLLAPFVRPGALVAQPKRARRTSKISTRPSEAGPKRVLRRRFLGLLRRPFPAQA